MSNKIETINPAIFHNVSTEFLVLAALFAIIAVATVFFVIHEMKNDI